MAVIVTTKEVRIEVDLLSLLREEFQARNIALKQPMISIERDSDGTFNFEKKRMQPAKPFCHLEHTDRSNDGTGIGACRVVMLIYNRKQTYRSDA